MLEGDADEFAHGVRLARSQHVVIGLLLLEHHPHAAHVVFGIAPIATGFEIAHPQLVGQAPDDAGHAHRDLPGQKLQPAAGRFVVEEDARDREHIVTLPIIHGDPVAVHLGHAIGAARPEGRALPLGNFLHLAKHLAAGSLVEANFLIDDANRFQHSRDAQPGDLARQDRLAPGCRHKRLSGKIIDFVRAMFFQQADEAGLIDEIAVDDLDFILNVLDAAEIAGAAAAHDADDIVAFFK